MNHGEEPADRIRKAGNLVSKAAERWNAGSPVVVEECAATLEETVAELHAVMATAMGRPDSLRGLRNEIFRIKEEVARMERLSHLAAAFLGGGSEAAGGSPLYRAGGFEDTGCLSMATTAIQA
jgi:hypothetical protein